MPPDAIPDDQARRGGVFYGLNREQWGRWIERGDFDCLGQINDSRIRDILINPPVYQPRNPYYAKTHRNAPGTVRAWFRQMRAADFAHDTVRPLSVNGVHYIDGVERTWTLFDTLKVIERETAATYLKIRA